MLMVSTMPSRFTGSISLSSSTTTLRAQLWGLALRAAARLSRAGMPTLTCRLPCLLLALHQPAPEWFPQRLLRRIPRPLSLRRRARLQRKPRS